MPGPRVFFPFLEIPPPPQRPWHFGFQTPRSAARLGETLAAPGAARSGLRAPRWPACFARLGITRRLPFASRGRGQGSSALAGTRPDRASSPVSRSLANLPDPGMAGRQHGLPRASGPLLALWHLGASAAPAADKAASIRPSARPSVPPSLPPLFFLSWPLPGPFPPRSRPSPCDGRSNTVLPWPACRTAHAGPSALPLTTSV